MCSRRFCRLALEARILCRALAIKHDADLLEGDGLSLWIRKVDHKDLEHDDCAYDDVVPGVQSVRHV